MTSGRKDCTSGVAKCEPMNRREALYCQGSHAKATRTQIAESMDINPSTLGNWIDPNGHEEIPEDRLDQMLRLTADNTAFAQFYADKQRLVVYDPKQKSGKSALRMVTEFSDVLRAHDEARADGVVTAAEALRFQREAKELHAAVDAEVRQALIDSGLVTAEDAR